MGYQIPFIENIFVIERHQTSSLSLIGKVIKNRSHALSMRIANFANRNQKFRSRASHQLHDTRIEIAKMENELEFLTNMSEILRRKSPVLVASTVIGLLMFIGGTALAANNIMLTRETAIGWSITSGLFGVAFGGIGFFGTLMMAEEWYEGMIARIPFVEGELEYLNDSIPELQEKARHAAISRLERLHKAQQSNKLATTGIGTPQHS